MRRNSLPWEILFVSILLKDKFAKRIEKVENVFKPGDKVVVKVYEIDDQGRINLITKALDDLKQEEKKTKEQQNEEE